MDNVFIEGVGSTTFGQHSNRTAVDLAVEASLNAIEDAKDDHDKIGTVYLGNFVSGVLTGQEVLAGLVADKLGISGVPATKVEGACASGGMAFRHACMAVASGSCEVALAVGVEKMTHAKTSLVTEALNCALDHEVDAASGLTYPGLFARVWQAHANKYGTTRADVSAVVKKNRSNGLMNPLASMGADLTDAEINQSAMIADPLTLFDCCPISDGAAAVVVMRKGSGSSNGSSNRIRVLASAQASGRARLSAHSDLCSFKATKTAAFQAFEMSGLNPSDIDFVELHDCFSIAEISDAEDLGFMQKGHGGGWASEGRTQVSGDLPINPSGGLEAKGHPVGATGLGQVYEVVQQLRGRHPNQVKNANIGLTHNLGGTGVSCTVNILGAAS